MFQIAQILKFLLGALVILGLVAAGLVALFVMFVRRHCGCWLLSLLAVSARIGGVHGAEFDRLGAA
jgi:hypothetical protein